MKLNSSLPTRQSICSPFTLRTRFVSLEPATPGLRVQRTLSTSTIMSLRGSLALESKMKLLRSPSRLLMGSLVEISCNSSTQQCLPRLKATPVQGAEMTTAKRIGRSSTVEQTFTRELLCRTGLSSNDV